MKVLILAVNYKTYSLLEEYIMSIEKAIDFNVEVELSIADNTPKSSKERILTIRKVPMNIYHFMDNPGYMKSIIRMWTQKYYSRRKEFDYVIMSNVDLQIDESFWNQLKKINYQQLAWISPDIITIRNNNHENPFMINRASIRRMLFFKMIYTNSFIYNFYIILSTLLRPNRRKNINLKLQEIYAGHGSIFIFTKEFLSDMKEINFEPYMYGEEIFFAELVRLRNMKTIFDPSLKVFNTGRSAGKIRGSQWECKVSRESIEFLIQKFWK